MMVPKVISPRTNATGLWGNKLFDRLSWEPYDADVAPVQETRRVLWPPLDGCRVAKGCVGSRMRRWLGEYD